MTKIITDKIREASSGGIYQAEDFLNKPMKLRIIGTDTEKFESQKDGKEYTKIHFHFENNIGEEVKISVLAFDSLVREMVKADPDDRDVLELSTAVYEGLKYPVWTVKVISKSEGKRGAATPRTSKKAEQTKVVSKINPHPPEKEEDDEEIKIEDIPF